jgi:PLD-like domain
MPTIYDNIDERLLPALSTALTLSGRSDFCVGYFNLRGWRQIDYLIERWDGGPGQQCRLLVGMQKLPYQELRELFTRDGAHELDNATAAALKRRLAAEFRDQLIVGFPTNEDENGLRRLLAQLRAGKVMVKLFLRHTLHAKLYLAFRTDPVNPIIGYLGSSNLTLSGLSKQGELNVDVLDSDAAKKLARWFEDRWDDKWCVDISSELIEVIEQSWARDWHKHHIFYASDIIFEHRCNFSDILRLKSGRSNLKHPKSKGMG